MLLKALRTTQSSSACKDHFSRLSFAFGLMSMAGESPKREYGNVLANRASAVDGATSDGCVGLSERYA